LFSLLTDVAMVKREGVIVPSPASIPEAPRALGHARDSNPAPWLLSPWGTQPCPQACSSPIPSPGTHAAPTEEGPARGFSALSPALL